MKNRLPAIIVVFAILLIDFTSCEKAGKYEPESILIYEPKLSTTDFQTPFCKYDNFTLQWNRDPDNKKGILLVLEWYGNIAHDNYNDQYNSYDNYESYIDYIPNTCVQNIACIPDTGKVVLESSFFDDVPDNALCNMYLLRGNITTDDIDMHGAYDYMEGVAWTVFQFILERDTQRQQ